MGKRSNIHKAADQGYLVLAVLWVGWGKRSNIHKAADQGYLVLAVLWVGWGKRSNIHNAADQGYLVLAVLWVGWGKRSNIQQLIAMVREGSSSRSEGAGGYGREDARRRRGWRLQDGKQAANWWF